MIVVPYHTSCEHQAVLLGQAIHELNGPPAFIKAGSLGPIRVTDLEVLPELVQEGWGRSFDWMVQVEPFGAEVNVELAAEVQQAATVEPQDG